MQALGGGGAEEAEEAEEAEGAEEESTSRPCATELRIILTSSARRY